MRFRAGHWPPSKLWPVVFHRTDRKAPPVGHSLVSGPLIGGGSYRVPASLWAGRSDLPAAGTSLALFNLQSACRSRLHLFSTTCEMAVDRCVRNPIAKGVESLENHIECRAHLWIAAHFGIYGHEPGQKTCQFTVSVNVVIAEVWFESFPVALIVMV